MMPRFTPGMFGGLGAAPAAPALMSGVPASIGQMPMTPSGPRPMVQVGNPAAPAGPAPMMHVGLPFSGRM